MKRLGLSSHDNLFPQIGKKIEEGYGKDAQLIQKILEEEVFSRCTLDPRTISIL